MSVRKEKDKKKNVFRLSWRVSFSSNVEVELSGQKIREKRVEGVKEGKKKEKHTLCLIRPPSSKNVIKVSSMERYCSGEESNKDVSP